MESFFISALMFLSTIGGGLPFGLPPAEEDPLMSAVAPDHCLAYISWSGTAEPDASSENEFEQLLTEPEMQFLFDEIELLVKNAMDLIEEEEGPREPNWVRQSAKWARRLLTRPAAAFISDVEIDPGGPPNIKGGLVVTVGEEGDELRKLWDTIRVEAPEDAVKEVEIGGVTMYRVLVEPDAPAITMGIKGNYLYAGIGDGSVEGMLERAKTDPPEWLTDLKTELAVERTSIVTYLNAGHAIDMVSKFLLGGPEGKVMLEAIGVGNFESLASVSGLDKTGFVTRALIGLDGEPTGLLAAAIGDPLTAAELNHIPADSTVAVAARFDAAKVFDTALATMAKFDPGAAEEFREEIGEMEEELGFGLRRDLLAGLGDSLYLYHSPGEGGLFAGVAAIVTVRDRDKIKGILDQYMKMAKAAEALGRDFGFGPRIGTTKAGDEEIHFVKFLDDDMPLSPAWCLTDDALIFGLFPQTIKAYLSRGDDYRSLADVPEVASALQDGAAPIKLVYQNTPYVFEMIYPFVQIGAQFVTAELREEGIDVDIAMLPSGQAIKKHLRPDVILVSKTDAGIEITNRQSFPGSNAGAFVPALGVVALALDGELDGIADGLVSVLSPSSAAEKASINNLKWLAISFHNYADAYRNFPTAYSVDDAGKPLLSWRVHILPFLDHGDLYDRFHLDEPWDSEHNKKLIPLMPKELMAPGSRHMEPGMTNYVTPRGEKTIFPGKKKISFADITDGTSNTIFLMEVNDKNAVIWTKPDDHDIDPMDPINGVVGLRKAGFLGAMADGSVRKFSDKIDKETFRLLFERNDGMPIDYDKLEPEHGRRGRRGARGSTTQRAVEIAPERREAEPKDAEPKDAEPEEDQP